MNSAINSNVIISSTVSGGSLHLLHMNHSSSNCCGIFEFIQPVNKHGIRQLGGHESLAKSLGAFYLSQEIKNEHSYNDDKGVESLVKSLAKIINEFSNRKNKKFVC